MKRTLGVDIGGTKIAAGLVDANGNVDYRYEIPSPNDCEEKLFHAVISTIEHVLEESGLHTNDLEGIGIGVPGKVDEDRGIAIYQNNLPWINFPVADMIRERLNVDRITVANDVVMATHAEWKAQQTKEEDTFVYVTVSTGIACSIIHQGTFLRGAGFSGEIGLLPSIYSEERIEEVASGPAIADHVMQMKKEEEPYELTTAEVFTQYNEGSKLEREVVEQALEEIAGGLYAVVCLLDPHSIVIGGGVVNHNPSVIDVLKNMLKQYLTNEQSDVLDRITPSVYKGDAGLVGAALKCT